MNTHISSDAPYHGPDLMAWLCSFKTAFLNLVAVDIWANNSLLWGVVLCTVGC